MMSEEIWVNRCCPTSCVEERQKLRVENERLRQALTMISSGKFSTSGDLVGAMWDELAMVKIAREALEMGR